jgi:hypothetical protein
LEGRDRSAILLFAAAALTRESMIAGFMGFIVYKLWKRHRLTWLYAVPFVAPLIWWAYIQMRLGELPVNFEIPPVVRLPFVGFANAMEVWLADPDQWAHLLMGIVLMALALVVIVKTFSGKLVAFVGAGFGLVAILMSEAVWLHYFDSTRALAPLFTLYALTIPGGSIESRPLESDALIDAGPHELASDAT